MKRRKFLTDTALVSAALSWPWSLDSVAATKASYLELVAKQSRTKLLAEPNRFTDVWTYGETQPGPTIRLKQGERVRVRLRNQLAEASSVHWHGIRIENSMDGVADLTQDAAAPGKTFEYDFVVPDAGTFWYHPHTRSMQQQARGMYGALIVDEAKPVLVDQDIVMLIDDWMLDQRGQILQASFGAMHDHAHGGRLGNWLSINGKPTPYSQTVVSGQRIRLRLINVANSRIFPLGFSSSIQPWLVAKDGQPVTPRKVSEQDLLLAPGQRRDLIIDMQGKPGAHAELQLLLEDSQLDLAKFEYHPSNKTKQFSDIEIPSLARNPLAKSIDLKKPLRREINMAGGAMGGLRTAYYEGKPLSVKELVAKGQIWAFNGVAGMPEQPLFKAELGRSIVLQFDNQNSWPHAMHLHGHHFQVIERDGVATGTQEWVDTELIAPGERLSIAFVADNPGKWLIHCHMLEHMLSGMVTWFSVS